MYDAGEGVPQDDGEAVKWFRLAADQGDALAQYSLGDMYRTGEGVPQDYGEAVKWFRLAADQGDASAQNNLGVMYEYGRGVPQDYGEAVKWYRLAADQGDALAQNNLGLMYAKGEGVPQNYIQAHMWLNLAGARGNEKARKTRDIVKDKMTPEQIAEAQRLASVWKPGMVIDAPAQMSELSSDGDALQQWDDDVMDGLPVRKRGGTALPLCTEGTPPIPTCATPTTTASYVIVVRFSHSIDSAAMASLPRPSG